MAMHIMDASQSTYFPTFSFSIRENPLTQMICDFFAELFSIIGEFLASLREPKQPIAEVSPNPTNEIPAELIASYRKRQKQILERERKSQGPTQEELKARLTELSYQHFAAKLLLEKYPDHKISSSLMTPPERGAFEPVQVDSKTREEAREGLREARRQLKLKLKAGNGGIC